MWGLVAIFLALCIGIWILWSAGILRSQKHEKPVEVVWGGWWGPWWGPWWYGGGGGSYSSWRGGWTPHGGRAAARPMPGAPGHGGWMGGHGGGYGGGHGGGHGGGGGRGGRR